MIQLNFKSLLLALAFTLFTAVNGTAESEKPIVKVGVFQIAPLVYIDDIGSPKGLFVDIIEEIANIEGWQVEYVKGAKFYFSL